MSKKKAAPLAASPPPRYRVLHCVACEIRGERVWISPATADRLAEVSAKKRDELEKKDRIRRLDHPSPAPVEARPPVNEEENHAGDQSSD